LSNAADSQVMSNVEKLGAPFHAVYTAEQAQAYKPRFQAFEYMFDQLGCGPQDVLHVSASPRYDLMVANDLGITHKVHVNRGFEPSTRATATTRLIRFPRCLRCSASEWPSGRHGQVLIVHVDRHDGLSC
jgi:FMN phosphatase YigB (HAD superfamily)